MAAYCYCDFEPNIPTRFVYIESGGIPRRRLLNTCTAITIVVWGSNFVKTIKSRIKIMTQVPA